MIGERLSRRIVGLINGIASQTDLFALNATDDITLHAEIPHRLAHTSARLSQPRNPIRKKSPTACNCRAATDWLPI
jgi:hypothetical protein